MTTVYDKYATARKELCAGMIERDTEVDLILTALVCKEHALLVGPPGTGKSWLANAMVQFVGGERFAILVTKFTTPEEFFGPISVVGLKNDSYRRILDHTLATASVAFVDEIFKSNSAILNTLLTILNERIVRNDGKVVHCPLQQMIAASNEWPNDQEGGKELQALFDRFLFRKTVRTIGTTRGIERLMWGNVTPPQVSVSVDQNEIDQAHDEAMRLPWTDPAKEAFREVLHRSRKEGIRVGDRRLRKGVMAVSAFAWMNAAAGVETDHLEVLEHILWEDPAEQPKKLISIINEVASPVGMKINQVQLEAEEVISSSDMKDLAKASVCDRKLGSIEKTLKGLGPRAESTLQYVQGERARLRRMAFQGQVESV